MENGKERILIKRDYKKMKLERQLSEGQQDYIFLKNAFKEKKIR